MALNWSVENVKDYKNLCWSEDRLNPVTEALIWAGNSLGFNIITERNYEEVYIRVHMWEHGVCSFLQKHENGESVDIPLTLKDIQQHIGLNTNWSTMTNAAFNKHLAAAMRRDATRVIEKQKK